MMMTTACVEVINIGEERATESTPLSMGSSGGVDIGQEMAPKIHKFVIKIMKPTKPSGKTTYSIRRELTKLTSSMQQQEEYPEQQRFVEMCNTAAALSSRMKMTRHEEVTKLSTKVHRGVKVSCKQPLKATTKESSPLRRPVWKKLKDTTDKRASMNDQGKQQEECKKVDGVDARRHQIRERIVEALSKVSGEVEHSDQAVVLRAVDDIAKLAKVMENELFLKLGPMHSVQVSHQYRSIMFNLGDPKNPDFRRALLLGHIKAQRLPTLTTKDMASQKVKEELILPNSTQKTNGSEVVGPDYNLSKSQIKGHIMRS